MAKNKELNVPWTSEELALLRACKTGDEVRHLHATGKFGKHTQAAVETRYSREKSATRPTLMTTMVDPQPSWEEICQGCGLLKLDCTCSSCNVSYDYQSLPMSLQCELDIATKNLDSAKQELGRVRDKAAQAGTVLTRIQEAESQLSALRVLALDLGVLPPPEPVKEPAKPLGIDLALESVLTYSSQVQVIIQGGARVLGGHAPNKGDKSPVVYPPAKLFEALVDFVTLVKEQSKQKLTGTVAIVPVNEFQKPLVKQSQVY